MSNTFPCDRKYRRNESLTFGNGVTFHLVSISIRQSNDLVVGCKKHLCWQIVAIWILMNWGTGRVREVVCLCPRQLGHRQDQRRLCPMLRQIDIMMVWGWRTWNWMCFK